MTPRWSTLLLIAGAALFVVAHVGVAYVAWSYLALPAALLMLLAVLVAHARGGASDSLHGFLRRHLRFCHHEGGE